MSKNQYRISHEAIKDLNNIWVYTLNKWSKEQADRYYDLIIAEIEVNLKSRIYLKGKDAFRCY